MKDGETSHTLEGVGKGVPKERKWRRGERFSEWEVFVTYSCQSPMFTLGTIH